MTHQAITLTAHKEPRLFEGAAAGQRLPNKTTRTEDKAAKSVVVCSELIPTGSTLQVNMTGQYKVMLAWPC